MPRRSHPAHRPAPAVWAPVAAVAVTAVLAGAARLMVGLRRRPPTGAIVGGAYAPEPLTGDPSSVEAADVAPV